MPSRWIDVLSDENVWGNSWELNGLQFGITAGESPEFEDEVVARKYSRIPLYYDWHLNLKIIMDSLSLEKIRV